MAAHQTDGVHFNMDLIAFKIDINNIYHVLALLLYILCFVFSSLAVEVARKEGRSYKDNLMLFLIVLAFVALKPVEISSFIKLILAIGGLVLIYYVVIYLFDRPDIKTKNRYLFVVTVNRICLTIFILYFVFRMWNFYSD